MIRVNPYSFNTKSYSRKNATARGGTFSKVISHPVSFSGAQRLLPNGNYPKKVIKLISLDIDGTISDRATNRVTDEVKDAIKSVMDRGIMVVLNTGRDYQDTLKVSNELGLETPVICNYGTYIKQGGKILYQNPVDRIDLKGDTLEYFANQLGIKKENIMSIGNDVEDISMFRKSGVSVFLENNHYLFDDDYISPYADYIVDNQNNSAVALAIKKLIK